MMKKKKPPERCYVSTEEGHLTGRGKRECGQEDFVEEMSCDES